mmetsp:Transcript_9716/g.37808  ORF Transcript_9716/g.37808 Transcript_9716/m.37808 type:complete len:360 (+) Transcript_9716:119-1198(+)
MKGGQAERGSRCLGALGLLLRVGRGVLAEHVDEAEEQSHVEEEVELQGAPPGAGVAPPTARGGEPHCGGDRTPPLGRDVGQEREDVGPSGSKSKDRERHQGGDELHDLKGGDPVLPPHALAEGHTAEVVVHHHVDKRVEEQANPLQRLPLLQPQPRHEQHQRMVKHVQEQVARRGALCKGEDGVGELVELGEVVDVRPKVQGAGCGPSSGAGELLGPVGRAGPAGRLGASHRRLAEQKASAIRPRLPQAHPHLVCAPQHHDEAPNAKHQVVPAHDGRPRARFPGGGRCRLWGRLGPSSGSGPGLLLRARRLAGLFARQHRGRQHCHDGKQVDASGTDWPVPRAERSGPPVEARRVREGS